jgi:hypothetical protein
MPAGRLKPPGKQDAVIDSRPGPRGEPVDEEELTGLIAGGTNGEKERVYIN